MIRVEQIIKSFGDQEVLHGIDADFERGKVNLVIGKSGSGKTVLVKCMVGLMQVDSGRILYENQDFGGLDKNAKKAIRNEIGMLFQGGALFDSATVEQNVRFPLDMFTKMTKAEKQKRVDFCLDRVNLKGQNDKFPGEISGGMMKRVGIARAIVLNPRYLFCDEPNSGLDPLTALVIDELIAELTHEFDITTIVNTHDMNSVMAIGENILFLHQGYKHWTGTKEDVLTAGNEELDQFIFASAFLQKAKEAMLGRKE